METVLNFLSDCKTFFLATVEGDSPKVRPFGATCNFGDKIYFVTNNKKEVYKQILNNPKIEISGTANGKWIRLSGNAKFDNSKDAKIAMIEANPGLKNMYNVDDGIMEVFYLENAVANILSVKGDKTTINL